MRALFASAALLCALSFVAGSSIVAPFREGVAAYSDILGILTGDEIQRHLDSSVELTTELDEWAAQLSTDAARMAVAFRGAEAAAVSKQGEHRDAAKGVVRSIIHTERSIASLRNDISEQEATASGLERDVAQAQTHLRETQSALDGHQRSLDAAQRKLNRLRNDCLSKRRRKRATGIRRRRGIFDDIGDFFVDDVGGGIVDAAEAAGDFFKHDVGGGIVEAAEDAGDFFKHDVGLGIVEAAETVANQVEKGICRTMGELSGSIRRTENLRDAARRSRDSASASLGHHQRRLASLRHTLQTSRARLASSESALSAQRASLGELRAVMIATGRLIEELSAAVSFLGELFVDGKSLAEALESVTVLNVDTLVEQLSRAAEDLHAAQLPQIPRPSAAEMELIRRRLRDFGRRLPDYPIVVKPEDLQ